MGRIPQPFIDDLLERADIVEVIDERVPLKKQGSNYKARCPFHEERTASFNVNPDRQIYHCFGCGAGGNALGFLMEYDHLRFPEAVRELAGRYNLTLPAEAAEETDSTTERSGPDPAFLYDLSEKAARYYEYCLRRHEEAERVHTYLRGRGVDGETAKRFRLGFAPPGWRNLLGAMGADGAARQGLVQVGLVAERNGSVYDRFRDRLMFPIRDRRGRVIAFGGRVLGDDEPKYLNSPEGPLFQKGRELYGLHEARAALRREERALVVEGYMDVIALAQAGVDYAVAPLGTALTEEQLRLLFRSVPEVVLAFDGDEAGRDAAWRTMETVLPLLGGGRVVRFLFLEEGDDPDSAVRREGPDAFRERVEAATPLLELMVQGLKGRVDLAIPEGRDRLLQLAGPLFTRIQDDRIREFLVQRLDAIAKLGPREVRAHLERAGGRGRRGASEGERSAPQASSEGAPRQPITRRALQLLLADPHDLAEDVRAVAEDLARSRSAGIQLLLTVAETAHDHPSLSTGALLERLRSDSHGEALLRLAGEDSGVPAEGRRSELKGCLHKLQAHAIRARLNALEEVARSGQMGPAEAQELKQLKHQQEALERVDQPTQGVAAQ